MKHQRAVEARHHGLSPHSSAYKAEMAKARAKDEAAIASQYGQSLPGAIRYTSQEDNEVLVCCCGETSDYIDDSDPNYTAPICCEIL